MANEEIARRCGVDSDTVRRWRSRLASDALFARRMDAVRIFARYQHALDPATEIPAEALGSRRYRPKEPNVFSENDIRALLAAADTLSPRFKALTWRTLIGPLAATGMRPGDACHLTVSDIDLTNGVIRVLQTKFGKSRLVFIHPTTVTAAARYLQARQEWVGTASRACPTVFVNRRRGPFNPYTLGVTFRQIVAAAGLTTEPGRRPVRLHDYADYALYRSSLCFRPHNPGGRRHRPNESSQPIREGAGWLAALLGAARIGEESLVCSFHYRMQR